MGLKRPAVISDRALTLLDALLLTAASGATVVVLGGGGRYTIAGFLLTIRSPANLSIATAVLLLLRLWLGRLRPLFPAARRLHTSAFERDREWYAAPLPWTRAARLAAAAGMLASLIWILPHLLHPRRVPDVGDPIFSAWRTARFAHQLLHDPRNLFDGNIFHPAARTLAYSDATVLQGTIAAPLVAAGVDPLIVSNAIMLSSFPLVALAFFALGWRLTADWRAAFLSSLLGALATSRFEQYSHVEMMLTPFIPLAALTMIRLAAAPTWRRGALLGALVVAQWLSGMYLGLMLLLWLVPLGGMLLLAWMRRPLRPLIEAVAAAGLVVGVGFGGLAIPYLAAQKAHGGWSNRTIGEFSAMGSDYRVPSARLWMARVIKKDPGPGERRLYPGLVTPALAIAALPAASPVGIASLTAGALAVDWSLGRRGLTYDDIANRVPAFSGMRVPARFSVLAITSLIMLAASGAARIFRALDRRRAGTACAAAIAAFAVFVDLRPAFTLMDFPDGTPPIYASLSPSSVVAEFPVGDDPNIAFMYFSTTHWARLINGYSGFFPEAYIEYQEAVKLFPAPETIDVARAAGATHLSFNCALETRTWRCERTLEILDARPDLEPVASGMWAGKPARLYRFK